MQKKRTLYIVLGLVVLIAILGLWNNFAPIKRLVGYARPTMTIVPVPSGEPVPFLTTEPGISVSVYAEGLDTPRVVAFDAAGRMFVSERDAGKVVRIDDANADGVTTVLDGLEHPHGLAFYTDTAAHATYLYVAQTSRVVRYPYNPSSGTLVSRSGKDIMDFPDVAGARHVTRTIAFSPNLRTSPLVEGNAPQQIPGASSPVKLYASVGSTCDTCVESSWKSAAILETDPDGQYTAQFAGGLRNAVFFTFHPVTGAMWATEMGRDNLGDNLPPDEVNVVTENAWYGWPFCYGNQVRDTTFTPTTVSRTDIPQDCAQTKAPVIEIPAHSAPLGLGFVPFGKGWPADWEGDLIVAYHGSWNRSVPTGYKVVRYDLDERGNVLHNADGTPKVTDLISGFYDGTKVYGRPVDVKFAADGALYITDDAAGRIYRVMPTR